MSTLTRSTRDGLLWVADVNDQPDGSIRVTIVETVGQRGYLDRRLSAARALARRAVGMTGPTRVVTAGHDGEPRRPGDPLVHFCGGQGLVTIAVWPREED